MNELETYHEKAGTLSISIAPSKEPSINEWIVTLCINDANVYAMLANITLSGKNSLDEAKVAAEKYLRTLVNAIVQDREALSKVLGKSISDETKIKFLKEQIEELRLLGEQGYGDGFADGEAEERGHSINGWEGSDTYEDLERLESSNGWELLGLTE